MLKAAACAVAAWAALAAGPAAAEWKRAETAHFIVYGDVPEQTIRRYAQKIERFDAFLRAYYHYKSADWPGNKPFRLAARTAEEMAKMPTYYIMDLDKGMAETVAPFMPLPAEVAANRWLPDAELHVYSEEFARTGFQGGLQWYRAGGIGAPEQQLFGARTIDVPSMFIAGASDWGAYQSPGALEQMQKGACTDMRGVHLVEGAGHWVQQERPEEVSRLLIGFLRR